jgi:ribosome biogenesis GTPase / thiamine phosphate phosphatase
MHGTVLSTTRRSAMVWRPETDDVRVATSSSRAIELTVGDRVEIEDRAGQTVITSISEAKNYLERGYFEQVRKVAANLDRLFIVTATGALFNLEFIDRLLVAGSTHDIPCTLVVNKIDKGTDAELPMIEHYRSVGVHVLLTSAKFGQGVEEVRSLLDDPSLEHAALVGMSGVGKSTLLNAFIPEAARKTGSVSEKTGQGKQTTSQAAGYLYRRSATPLLLIDCPGIQRFGLGYLDDVLVSQHFPELRALQPGCQYADCKHSVEPACAVRAALERGEIPHSRYESYRAILDEIVENRSYSK